MSTDLRRISRSAVVGLSVLALSCVVGTASAGTKSKKDASADAEKAQKKVLLMSKQGERTFLGVTMQGLDENVRKGLDVSVKSGVLVTDVVEGSPAEAAGIESGDVIVEFKGRTVESPSELREMVEESGVGEEAKVRVVRDKKAKTVTVTLGSYPGGQPWSFVAPEHFKWFGDGGEALADVFVNRGRLGVRVTELNEDLGAYFGVKKGEGVLVLEVTEESPGHAMGIKAGDVIVGVAGEKVGSVSDLREAVGELEEGDKFDVAVIRSKADVTLRGEMDKGLPKMYSGTLPRDFNVRIPDLESRHFAQEEMEGLKEEMKALKKELDELKDELKRAKKST